MKRSYARNLFCLLLLMSLAATTGCGLLSATPTIDTSERLEPTPREVRILASYHLKAHTRRGQNKLREIRHTDATIQKAREHMAELRKKSRKFDTPINELYGTPNVRPVVTKPAVGMQVMSQIY